ncbi:hypothetical protein PORY_001419 [Pneumocystis oryctolagi]|uniref:Uncharacterized protein n=1 Tax=Pneumocystis oryctolagi TaxID=42067 RepID=A0ACB7CEE1_9ASCO|nr:hypothetical protein PORY_001419 [Pneumocystis oryctolagi]
MRWIFVLVYILPTCFGFFKQNQEAKSNCYGSLMCGPSMVGNCWLAIDKYETDKYYSRYTSKTESGFGYGSGCTVIYTCDKMVYLNVSGSDIRKKATTIVKKCQDDPGIPCGSDYFDTVKQRCRVTVNYCAECYDRG